MRQETQNLLLLLFGGALLKIVLTGDYVRYVKPTLQPWLIAAGVVMVVLALIAIVGDIRAARAEDRAVATDEDDSGELPDSAASEAETPPSAACATDCHGGSHSPWMLLLPVLAVFLVARPALGADSVDRAAGRSMPAPTRKETLFADLPPGGAPLLEISELVTRVVWDESGALNGRTVRLQGFVVHPKDGGPPQLAKMRITCCAADATPVKVSLTGPAADKAERAPSDEWLEVTGKVIPGTATEQNGQVPTFEITEAKKIPLPENPYEY